MSKSDQFYKSIGQTVISVAAFVSFLAAAEAVERKVNTGSFKASSRK